MRDKDRWNKLSPTQDDQFAEYVAQPELAKLLPVLYPAYSPTSPNAPPAAPTSWRSC